MGGFGGVDSPARRDTEHMGVELTLRGPSTEVPLRSDYEHALVVLQVMFGFANVAWALPTVLREAHAADAVATFLAFVGSLVFAAIDETVPAASRASVPSPSNVEPAR